MSGDLVRRGRLSGTRPEVVTAYLSSMDTDRWIASADIRVDIAHLLMLDRQGIVSRDTASAVMKQLIGMYENGIPESAFDQQFEDIHAGIEAHIIAEAGMQHGGRLHMGRSRNDEVATCIRVRLREEILEQLEGLIRLRSTLLDIADANRDTIMPGFTHLQHAQPTTLAHYMLSYEHAFGRDFERLTDAYVRVNRCPLGSAAFASTGYPIDRSYTAGLLGFPDLSLNTMDAVAARDFALETIAACTILMSTMSRLCEELILWSSAFVEFVTLDDAYCSTSSIMPQKKNPDTAEIMRGKTGAVAGAFTAALMTVKGLPMSYNRDLQDLTPSLWRAVVEAGRAVEIAAGMLATATFHPERMRAEAGRGFSTATDLADLLVRNYGLAFRESHNIVGRAVKKGSVDLASLDEAAVEITGTALSARGLTPGAIEEALDPAYSVSVRCAAGGPAPGAVAAQLAIRREAMREDADWVTDEKTRLAEAECAMLAQGRELIA
ncbi:MAG TPA: argininosuccinate lyase [Methanoculleus sp.]|mgnify:CR=1 FL=1|nr:argininosuccinate lyase [Methanoculleus sp.]